MLLSVYMTRPFFRFARKARISDAALWGTAERAERGQIDADLGGGVIKQRIARRGEGKSGGSRSIVLFRRGARAIFVHGFEKKDRANIGPRDLEAFRKLAEVLLDFTDAEIAERIASGTLISIPNPQGAGNG